MNTAYDGQERVRPSGRNGNQLPLRKRGERIGGRQKGTPNKIPREFKEALIAAAVARARGKPLGKFPTGEGELRELQWLLEWFEAIDLKGFARLFVRVLGQKSRARDPTEMLSDRASSSCEMGLNGQL